MNTKQIGDISEAKVMTRILELGMIALQPVGDRARYDLAMDDDGRIQKIQVKTVSFTKSGNFLIRAYSRNKMSIGWVEKRYVGQVDFIAAYCRENGNCYLLPIDLFKNRGEITLCSIKPAKSRPGKYYATDFLF